ncbi:MAG: hypothetical protein ABW162_03140 [Candidatus Sedimenticola sp. PURPLELP]
MLETILGLGAGAMLFVLLIWLLPIIFILKSNKTSGGEKLVWLIAVLFFSWFSWIIYMLLAPIGSKN